jgi:hypothetical protein
MRNLGTANSDHSPCSFDSPNCPVPTNSAPLSVLIPAGTPNSRMAACQVTVLRSPFRKDPMAIVDPFASMRHLSHAVQPAERAWGQDSRSRT